MGMAMGKGNGLLVEMNVVPLIDILLVLLIIFMVITPTTPTGLDAEAPQADQQAARNPEPEAVVVWITRSGQLRINQEDTDWERMGGRLEEIFKSRARKVAFVWGDSEVEFREVARTISIMRDSGIDRVGLLPAEFGEELPRPAEDRRSRGVR